KRKVTRNPRLHNMGVSNVTEPRHIVPIQLTNLTPVGTAMSIVIRAKNGSNTEPVAYMWCAQTVIDNAAIAAVAKTNDLYPKIGFREKTGITSVIIPKNGSAIIYTSGCPKNQNKCCHRMAPPFSGSKMWPPKRRSSPSPNRAAASGGNAISTSSDVISAFQVKIGTRHMVMPGARSVMIVVAIL